MSMRTDEERHELATLLNAGKPTAKGAEIGGYVLTSVAAENGEPLVTVSDPTHPDIASLGMKAALLGIDEHGQPLRGLDAIYRWLLEIEREDMRAEEEAAALAAAAASEAEA